MLPFDGIFDVARPAHGGHARWQWDDADLNQAATKLLAHVDRTLEQFVDRDAMWLGTLELDLNHGRFPEALAEFFADPTWDDTTRFHVPALLKDSAESSSEIGTLVCELCPGRLRRLLAMGDGFRWGSALRVGGVQVPTASAAIAIKGSLFDSAHASAVERVAKYAWAASADLNAIALWTAVQDGTWRRRVEVLAPRSSG